MAMKKSTKPPRPGQGQVGGPPNPSKMKVSSGLTVLGKIQPGSLAGNRAPLSNATMKELKAMIAKGDAAKAAVAKSSKKDAKIVKKQNKQATTAKTATAQQSRRIKMAKKPVVKVTPRSGGMRGGGGMLGGGGGLRTYNR